MRIQTLQTYERSHDKSGCSHRRILELCSTFDHRHLNESIAGCNEIQGHLYDEGNVSGLARLIYLVFIVVKCKRYKEVDYKDDDFIDEYNPPTVDQEF